MQIELIKPDKSKGFSCPYILFLPNGKCSGKHLVVEMGNPEVSESAEQSIKSQIDAFLSCSPFMSAYKKALCNSSSPMIMPIFPRPIVDGKDICVIEFNHTALETEHENLKRMDLQTLAMIQDAKQRLNEKSINVLDKIVLTGYSSSAQFALRFSVIYPEIVHSVIAGGFNGLGTLPISKVDGYEANFPLGINDIKEKFGKEFNEKEFSKIKHFLYMGSEDRHIYHKPFTVGEQASKFVENVFAGDIINDRLKKYLNILASKTNVQFMLVNNCGHFIGNKMASEPHFKDYFESAFSKVLTSIQSQKELEK